MTLSVALLRGINVGPTTRLSMVDLREALASLGYSNIRTVLNSGNAIFEGAAGPPAQEAERIHAALEARLGLRIQVLVKAGKEIAAIVGENPLTGMASNASRLILTFTQERSSLTRLAGLVQKDWSPEALAVGKHAAYMWCPNGTIASRVAQEVGRTLGELGTTRNWSTVEKIHGLLSEEGN